MILVQSKVSQFVCNRILENTEQIKEKWLQWEGKLNITLTMETFQSYFKNIYIITNHSKLRSFQYRLLLHAIVTNRNVYNSGLIESGLCTFCQNASMTTRHLLYNCSVVQEFIKKAMQEINALITYDTLVEIDIQSFLFNNVRPNPSHIFNFLILVIKYFIYKCRCAKAVLSTHALKEELKLIRNIEKFNAEAHLSLS